MKILFSIMLLVGFCVAAEDALQICKFPDGKKAMMALTFDDILDDQIKYAPAILEKHGFKATFYMIPSRLGKKGRAKYAELKDILPLLKAGHEIGNHTTSHGPVLENFEKKNFEVLNYLVVGGQNTIQELTGVRPLSFCYPGNRRSADTDKWVLQTHLVVTTRTRKLQKTPEKVRAQLRQMIEKGTFGDTMIHGIVEGYDPYKSVEDFEACIAELKNHENDIAIGTMLELGCYEKRFAGTKLTPLADKVYLLELAPEFRQYAGELSLQLPNAKKYTVRVNNTPIATDGVFKARTGDVIAILPNLE